MQKKHGARIGQLRDVAAANQQWVARGQLVSVRSTVTEPLVVDPHRGEECVVYDVAGNRYLDFGVVGTDNFGFGLPRSLKAGRIAQDLLVPLMPEQDILNVEGILAKEQLAALTPLVGSGLVYGARSGSDANEVALDALVRARPIRRTFGAFERCFHGRNTGIRSFLDYTPNKKKWDRVKHYPTPYHVVKLPFPSTALLNPLATLQEAFSKVDASWWKKMNGFFFEIVQGEGGINVADKEALVWLVDRLREFDVAVVVDEVQTGMGRTGTLWAYEQYGVLPDIVTMGKSLGGGLVDIAAVVMADRWNFKEVGARASTYGFEPTKAVAVQIALDELKRRRLCARAQSIGRTLQGRLSSLADPRGIIRGVRGLGAMYALEFINAPRRDRVLKKTLSYGLILHQCGYSEENPSIRIMPPLVISKRQLDQGVSILERCLAE